MALTHRGRPTGAIVHSDCGSQFRPAAFTAMIKTRGLAFSMGAVGICADDAATGILLSACPRKQQAQPHTSGTLPTSSAKASSFGSKAATAANANNEPWANSHSSNTKQLTPQQYKHKPTTKTTAAPRSAAMVRAGPPGGLSITQPPDGETPPNSSYVP